MSVTAEQDFRLLILKQLSEFKLKLDSMEQTALHQNAATALILECVDNGKLREAVKRNPRLLALLKQGGVFPPGLG